MTKSKIFLYFCLSFIGGIFLSSIITPHLLIIGGGLILGILLISIFWEYKKFVVIGFCILFLVLGIWRHQQAELRIMNNELRKYNDREEKVTLVGIVSAEPDIRETNTKLTIQITEINQDETTTHPLPSQPSAEPLISRSVKGRILVMAGRYPEYQYGDKLKIIGELKTPQELGDFDYPGYLAKDGIYSVIYWPKIELLERENYRSPTSIIYGKILEFKNKLRGSVYQNLSPPQSLILGAMILGDKRQLSEDLKNKLNITGVRHITAVSGLHVTVLSTILMSFLIWLGLWRQQAFYFAIFFIAFFIIMTGLQPSAIRAGIMGGLYLLAQYLGRMGSSSRAIFFAGAVMLTQNPLLLRLDVGFQLSFLAMMGIIYLSPIFREYLKFIPWQNPKSILAMTFSAYFFSLPILIFNFGYVSLIAPLTNILILPLLYWIMIFGFIFGLAGMVFPILGWILSFPAWLILTYSIKVVDFLSQIPFAYKTLEISWIWLIVSYLILGYLTWRLNEKRKLKFLNY